MFACGLPLYSMLLLLIFKSVNAYTEMHIQTQLYEQLYCFVTKGDVSHSLDYSDSVRCRDYLSS